MLLIVFNKLLKDTTRQRIRALGLQNVEAHSFHSASRRFYNEEYFDSAGLLMVLDDDVPPLNKLSFDILILDEAQDHRPFLFQMACKILCDNEKGPVQMVVLGDTRQTVYEARAPHNAGGSGQRSQQCRPVPLGILLAG